MFLIFFNIHQKTVLMLHSCPAVKEEPYPFFKIASKIAIVWA
jgi:hypothetical protein